MANYISITRILQMAYGAGAQIVGIPFNVYRIQNNGATNYIDSTNLIASNIRVDRQPVASGNKGFETTRRMEVMWWELMGNFNNFQVGDVFVSNDTVLNQGWVEVPYSSDDFIGFMLAENMPTRAPIGARLHTQAKLYTANILPNGSNIFDNTQPNKQPIVLSNGTFSPASMGTAANIPIAYMPHRNYGDIYQPYTPNMTPMERRIVYVPPLNGYQPVAGDEFVFQDGSHYYIESNYHQDSGTVGNQFLCAKVVDGAG